MTAEKFTSNRGSIPGGFIERRSVVGDGGGGKPVDVLAGQIFSSSDGGSTNNHDHQHRFTDQHIPEEETFFKRVLACSISF